MEGREQGARVAEAGTDSLTGLPADTGSPSWARTRTLLIQRAIAGCQTPASCKFHATRVTRCWSLLGLVLDFSCPTQMSEFRSRVTLLVTARLTLAAEANPVNRLGTVCRIVSARAGHTARGAPLSDAR